MAGTKLVAAQAPTTTNGVGEDGAPERAEFAVHDPADGSVVTTVPVHDADRVTETVARLRAAQPAWEALGYEGRRRWLERFRGWLLENADSISEIMRSETGKVQQEADGEVPYLADTINFYGRNAGRFLADEQVEAHSLFLKTKALKVVYRPQPVVGIISPWNFPLMLSIGDGLPALCAGCAVVIKPSEFTPLCLLEVVRGWKEEVGGPDVLDVVTGLGETGSALVDEVDYVQFTGSVATGKKVMARAAETLTPVSLELGGKDPMIVLDDANLERAVNGAAWGGLMNSGQICMSVERVYVQETIYDEFVSKLTSKVRNLRQGKDEPSYSHEVGAMTTPAQIEIVEDQVDDALASGATALAGGKRREGPGDYYEPTVLVGVDHSMKVMREETFGPVIPVMKVKDEEEAIRLANDSEYGLSASVWTRNRERGERIARRIEAGACNVNDVLINYLASDVPMGGWKHSGIGARHGVGGIRKFCRTESIVISRLAWQSEPMWFPYGPRKARVLRFLQRLILGRGRRKRPGL